MKGRRIAAALALLLAAAPGTCWRSAVAARPDAEVAIVALALPDDADPIAGLRATGLWRIRGNGVGLGGYSALVALRDGRLRAFSDRGWRLVLMRPGTGGGRASAARMIPAEGYRQALFDIEAAARDTADGTYWLAYEGTHAIQRFDNASVAGPVRDLAREVDWPVNNGIEAMARLADGRFVVLPETGANGLIFAGDPTEGAAVRTFSIRWPLAEFDPTDAVQLPDGRLLVLARRLRVAIPQDFDSALLIGDVPRAGEQWRPQVLARLETLLPRENYEGMALRRLPGGASEIWLISDDNFSAFQRTLLARLEYRPNAGPANERAREAVPRAPQSPSGNSSD